MSLPIALVEQFYEIWRPLLSFANKQLQVVPTLAGQGHEDSIDVNHAIKVRDAVWQNEAVIDQFINNPWLPDDDYGFLEAYCNDENCDCRRVFFNVISRKRVE